MDGTIELEVPPRNDQIALVRVVVSAAARTAGALPDRRVDDLRLAVSEACTNAVDSQRARGSEDPIVVRVQVAATAVTVTVTDHGGGFDPDAEPALPEATDPRRLRHERGLGLPLMRSLADALTFRPVPGGTEVTLVVRAPAG